jgi:hypothetical protein
MRNHWHYFVLSCFFPIKRNYKNIPIYETRVVLSLRVVNPCVGHLDSLETSRVFDVCHMSYVDACCTCVRHIAYYSFNRYISGCNCKPKTFLEHAYHGCVQFITRQIDNCLFDPSSFDLSPFGPKLGCLIIFF